jgi:protein ImuB
MSVPEARSILPRLHLEHFDSLQSEQRDLQALARTLEGLAPHPQHLDSDTLFVRIEKTASQIGGETACVELAMRQLRSMGHLARVWIVDGDRTGSVQAARALAQWKQKHQIVPVDGLAEALEELPLHMLTISKELYESLHALGVRTAGSLSRIPLASLSHRYGPEGVWLGRLCRAKKRDILPPPPVAVQKQPVFRDHFDSPVCDRNRLLLSLKNATAQLSKSLSQHNKACLTLTLRLQFEEGPNKDIQVQFSQAQQHADSLSEALDKTLEELQVESRIESYELEALNLCSHSGGIQKNLLDRSTNQEEFSVLCERLSRTLHNAPILSPRINHQHHPERAWDCTNRTQQSPSSVLPSDSRPTLMLPQALPIRTGLQCGVPATLDIDGRRWKVIEAQGPERICGDWWRPSSFHRDYWRIGLSDGRELWIFCDNDSECWWLQGFFE